MMTTMTQTAADHYMYKGVVSLNNIGCVLLEQGAYQQAMDTIRDAIVVMKTIVPTRKGENRNSPVASGHPTTNLNLEGRLNKATQRMAFPQPMVARSMQQQRSTAAIRHDAPPPIATITLADYCQLEIDDVLMLHPDEQMLMCPIRIEDESEHHGTLNQDLDSAILLFNLGLSHSCLARCQADESVREQLQDAAIHIFGLADSILVQLSSQQSMECNTLTAHHDVKRVTCTNMAVLHSLLQVRMEQQQHCYVDDEDDMELDDDCADVIDRLYYLQNCVFMNEQLAPLQLERCFPAAAA
jgi:hypothetical protein